jgi:light-regulated signal transduction histidine kinase (bacteriophytochrome)
VQDREFAAYRQKLNSVHDTLVTKAGSEGSLEPLVRGDQTLLDGIDAGGIAILHRGRWQTVGKVPSEPQLTGLATWLNEHSQLKDPGAAPFATDTLPAQYPPAKDFAATASGLLAISIAQNRRGLILWFRPETIQTFTWGGNPNELPLVAGPHGPRLTPRKSFELWRETVHNRSLPWKAVEIEAAARLQTLIINFVVKHAEELEELNALLVDRNDELEAFAYVASHDLKEPLRGIHKYASQLSESPALSEGSESKERLEGITRLAVRMDDLINALLHYARVSRSEKTSEGVDLNLVVREAIEMLGVMVDETGTRIDIPRPLPMVECDRIRTREIFANLISNGIKYNDQAQKELQIGCIAPTEQAAAPERHHLPATARGQFVFYVKDNGIGIEKRHHETIFRIFKRLHGRDAYRGGSGAGLAIVKRLIDQHGGVIWLESEPKRGTTFYFTLSKEQ